MLGRMQFADHARTAFSRAVRNEGRCQGVPYQAANVGPTDTAVHLRWAPFATNPRDLGSGTARCVGSSPSGLDYRLQR